MPKLVFPDHRKTDKTKTGHICLNSFRSKQNLIESVLETTVDAT